MVIFVENKHKQKIINDMTNYIIKHGQGYAGWYVGITKDINERLFEYHNVTKNTGTYIYYTAPSSEIAREIEKYFLAHGADGGTGGGNKEDTDIIYIYKITNYTKERD